METTDISVRTGERRLPSSDLRRVGRAQRALARAYERVGVRWIVLCLGVATLGVLVTYWETMLWLARDLRVSTATFWRLEATSIPVAVAGLAFALYVSRKPLGTAVSWAAGDRNPDRAPEAWNAVVTGLWVSIARSIVWFLPALAGLSGLLVLIMGEDAGAVVPVFLSIIAGAGSGSVVIAFVVEFMVRPIADDIASYLPSDFEPTRRIWRLRTKAVAPLPAVAFFGVLTAGAFVDLAPTGTGRVALALAIAVATAAAAGTIFLILTRSTLDPLEQILDGTRRVRDGELDVDVPVVTADDLGQLAYSFNQMLEGLRQRESLQTRNAELTSALQNSLRDLRHQAEELQASRARIVAASDAARRQVERDLHDGAQQRLVLLNLKLGLVERALNEDAAARTGIADARLELGLALADLRNLAHGIYPAVLANEGLSGALRDAAASAAIPTAVECGSAVRFPPEIEAAVYFCCLEALQNAGKYAGEGAQARICLTTRGGALAFQIIDDGAGFDPKLTPRSQGLQNMVDRVGALGGELTIESTPGDGTAVTGTVPLRTL